MGFVPFFVNGSFPRTAILSPRPEGLTSVYDENVLTISSAHGSMRPVSGSRTSSRSMKIKGSSGVRTNPIPACPCSSKAATARSKESQLPGSFQSIDRLFAGSTGGFLLLSAL